jgi:hypothetical protein
MTAMKPISTIFALAAFTTLAGCSSVAHMSYGSWLDHVGERHAPRYPFSADEKQALGAKADELHARADSVRLKMASEKDRVQRVAYLHQLDDISAEVRPIEKQLRAGGSDTRRYPQPPDYTQAGGQ